MLNDVKPPPLDRPETALDPAHPPVPASATTVSAAQVTASQGGVVFNPPTVPHSTPAGGPARGIEAHPSGHVVANIDEKEIGRVQSTQNSAKLS